MTGELDPFDFDLALALGCTVAEMRQRISNDEYLQHRALTVKRAAEAELARKMR